MIRPFRKLYEDLRDNVLRHAPAPTAAKRRKDRGPTAQWYVRACFPRSSFTKKLTKCRRKAILAAYHRLRPEQQEVARRHGYTKGLI